MRRAIQALTIGGVLFAVVACGTAKGPAASGPAGVGQSVSAAQPALTEKKALCEALGKVYGENMGTFAAALSKMIAGRKAPGGEKASLEQAQRTLGDFATAIRGATQTSADPQVRADGEQTAGRLQAKAADDTFFSEIQTTKDVDTVLGSTLKEWLAPVTRHCS